MKNQKKSIIKNLKLQLPNFMMEMQKNSINEATIAEQNQKTIATIDEGQKVLIILLKRSTFISKLKTNNVEYFRQININEYDLNLTQNFQQLEHIDDALTPLIYTAFYGYKEICRRLLTNAEIDVDLQTSNNKQTPLIIACMYGNYEIVRLLLLNKAQCNKPNLFNHTSLTVTLFRLMQQPIQFENQKICFLIADLLVKYGADINWIIDKTIGYSLLHYFCSVKIKMNSILNLINQQVIQWLLQKGANPTLKTLQDITCKDMVKNIGNLKIQKLLQKYQIEYNSKLQLNYYKFKIKKIPQNFFHVPQK